MGIYYKNVFDLITSISLICKKNYTTNISNSISNKRLTKVERSIFKIGVPLNEIIIGLLLGDGHIQSRQLKGNSSRFMYGQSSLRENHLNYFYHIFDLFKPFISKEYIIKSRSFLDKRKNKTYSSVLFATLTLPCFTFYRELFYNSQGKKIVPLNINQLLTPRGLAYWIMDDGSIQNKGLHLNVYGFSLEEVINLKNTLENLFIRYPLALSAKPKDASVIGPSAGVMLKCSIHNHKKGYILYIFEESMIIVRNHIHQYMHKDMLYKINPPLLSPCATLACEL